MLTSCVTGRLTLISVFPLQNGDNTDTGLDFEDIENVLEMGSIPILVLVFCYFLKIGFSLKEGHDQISSGHQ